MTIDGLDRKRTGVINPIVVVMQHPAFPGV